MGTKRPLVAGNWKMEGSRQLASDVLAQLKPLAGENFEALLCPPHVYLDNIQQQLADYDEQDVCVALGSQNINQFAGGAHTGEVSISMVQEFGAKYVTVGHSERRASYGDSNDVVTAKFIMTQKAGLTPILCIGESEQTREQGKTFEVLTEELDAVVDVVGIDAFHNAVIAYEPTWAIGTGNSATPEQAQEVHAFIRQYLADKSPEVAERIRILYGGSVKPSNATDLFSQTDVDGGLVGGASLNAEDFVALCRIAAQTA